MAIGSGEGSGIRIKDGKDEFLTGDDLLGQAASPPGPVGNGKW